MRLVIAGAIAAILLVVLVGFASIELGLVPARADTSASAVERWAARTSLRATIKREAPQPPYPFPDTPEAQKRGAALYVQNCAVCHGTARQTTNAISLGLSIRPPQFNRRGVDDDPAGETYWKVQHGIRFTGMPSYGHSLDRQSLWDITYFLAHKPSELAPAARAIWEHPQTVPPPTPLPQPPKAGQGAPNPG